MLAASARNLFRFSPPAALVLLLALLPGVALAVDAVSARNSVELAERGIEIAARGDLATAQRFLERAVAANPANARAYAHLGGVHQSMSDKRLARKYYGIALVIDPTEPDALNRIAQLDLAEGNRTAAEQRLRVLRFHCETCEQTQELARVLSSGPAAPLEP
ncbi:MAG: hypothetical protein WD034_06070 [Parvibaculum sp.]|uniref:tetratricopeptide repeat protein n=1 Tax=Parvibaculum sp. TaxID=2024848 RepID=UPI0034A057E4